MKILGVMEIFCSLTISMSVFLVMIYDSLQDVTTMGKLGEGYMISFCIISYEFMWIYNYLKRKKSNFFLN